MIERKELRCWEEFECEYRSILAEKRETRGGHVDHPLFRGQADSRWRLESTLDRLRKGMSVSIYCDEVVPIVRDHVATCTGRKWDLTRENGRLGGGLNLPYEFMAYLRHNGFPSPLLDWTRSPFIAAYFAFGDAFLRSKHQEHVSIYVCTEHFCAGEESQIRSLGPTIATHPNHYLQQSEYTICVEWKDGETHFANYEDVVGEESCSVLTKYDIPVSEQGKVLRQLDLMNITAYSLFDSEPSLMDTLAIRELVIETG